jgi:hypothetical protein
LNNYFDRYFFSTIPEVVSDWDLGLPLPNQRIVRARNDSNDNELSSPRAANELFVRGGFNINSVSSNSWSAILQHSKLSELTYTNSDGESLSYSTDATAYFNHSYGGEIHISNESPEYQPRHAGQEEELIQSFGVDGSHESFVQGYRLLTSTILSELAGRISDKILVYTETNQRPFLSLTQFLNTGILQEAIDETEGLNKISGLGRIPTLSSAYFGVGSILNHLSTHLFTRSDTFIVRSSGSLLSQNPDLENTSVYLETKVQRIPYDEIGPFGRRYKIVGMKWIDVSP